jgi:tetratricopeptide (TPR) repeat protein
MRVTLVMLMLVSAAGSPAADLRSDLAAGQECYRQGDFKRAVSHFRRALRVDEYDAELNYWMGRAYQGRGDVATPFGGGYNSKALVYLRRAVALAPDRGEYRRELFDFLVYSAEGSPARLRLAADLVSRTSESDPEYPLMRRRLELAVRMASSPNARLDRLMLGVPRTVFGVMQR